MSSDERGLVTNFEVNPVNGNTLSAFYDDGNSSAFTYTDSGQIETVRDENDVITRYSYDALGRVERIDFAEGTVDQAFQRFEYDDAGNQTLFVDENGNQTVFDYDELNRLTLIRDHLGGETTFDYDDAGNLIETVDAEQNTTTNDYDERNRLAATIDGLSNTTRYFYDTENNLIRVQDPLNFSTRNDYDERNRLVWTQDAELGLTQFTYDGNGNLRTLQDPENNTTQFFYDAKDRLISETDPLSATTRYEYDGVDNLIRKIDRNDRTTTYEYDQRNRLVEEVWTGGAFDNTIEYDYDPVGNLLLATDIGSSLTYTYDFRNRVKTVFNGGTDGAPEVLIEYTYDDVGNVRFVDDTIDGVSGARTEYEYDELNRVDRIAQSELVVDGINPVDPKSVTFGYNAIGQYKTINRYSDLEGSNLVARTLYGYDDINRLETLEHGTSVDEIRDLAFFEYEYDDASRITQIDDIEGLTVYGYDKTNQLTSADRAFADIRGDESYSYDKNGNRTSSHLHGNAYQTETGNRLVFDGTYRYEYDAEGNMTRRTVEVANDESGPVGSYREFTWDNRNRLMSVSDFSAIGELLVNTNYRYDGFNRRYFEENDETPQFLVYDREDIVVAFSVDGTQIDTMRYLHGPLIDQVLTEESSSESKWALADHVGTVSRYVTATESGSAVYDSFGNLLTANNEDLRYGFSGRELDESTDLQYFRARYYDSSVGQFISSDPIGDGFNHFAFVGNNPVSNIDPFGLQSEPALSNLSDDELGAALKRLRAEELQRTQRMFQIMNPARGADFATQEQSIFGTIDPTRTFNFDPINPLLELVPIGDLLESGRIGIKAIEEEQARRRGVNQEPITRQGNGREQLESCSPLPIPNILRVRRIPGS